MLLGADFYEGEGAHIYRSVSDIRADIEEVGGQIAEINDALNIRNLVVELISDSAMKKPAEWLPELAELIREAKESLNRLYELNDTLDELNEELEYTRYALGV